MIKIAGAKSRMYGDGPTFPKQTFVANCESAVPYVVGHCNGGESTSINKIETFSMLEKACNSSDFQVRPVFQVGHHVELPQLCSCCTYALNHMTTNTRALCYIYQ